VMVDHIRRHCPGAVIMGELAPFTFSRNDEEGIVSEFLRDYDLIGDTRGLLFTTAGGINNGSRLTGMRLIMSAIQHFGRYDQ
jgi:uroporphyrinogen decarboxylase